MTDHEIATAVSALVAERGAGKSACPSEVARRLAPQDWRALMPAVRRVAADMAARGEIALTQRGRQVDHTARGPVRLAQPDRPAATER